VPQKSHAGTPARQCSTSFFRVAGRFCLDSTKQNNFAAIIAEILKKLLFLQR